MNKEIIEKREDYEAIYDEGYYSGKKSFFYKISGGYKDFKPFFDRLARWFMPWLRPGPLLDAGCAYGFMLQRLNDGRRLVGSDVSEHALSVAAKNLPDAELVVNCLGDAALPFEDGSFASIICNDVIEHLTVAHRDAAITDFYRLLEPGGTLCVTTPNANLLRRIFYRIPDRMEHHIGMLTLAGWETVFRRGGFDITDRWSFPHGMLPIRNRIAIWPECALILTKPRSTER